MSHLTYLSTYLWCLCVINLKRVLKKYDENG